MNFLIPFFLAALPPSFSSDTLVWNSKGQTLSSSGQTHLSTVDGLSFSCDGLLTFNNDTSSLTLESDKTPILFSQNGIEIRAKDGLVHFTNEKPDTLSFTSDVHILNQDLDGAADQIIYSLADKRIELIAEEGKKVTFKSREQTMQMVADKIVIDLDPDTHQHRIQGKGKVVFRFEEKDKEQLLDKIRVCVKNLF